MPEEQNTFEALYDQVKCYMIFYKDSFLAHNFQDEQFQNNAPNKMRHFNTCFDIAQFWEAVQVFSDGEAQILTHRYDNNFNRFVKNLWKIEVVVPVYNMMTEIKLARKMLDQHKFLIEKYLTWFDKDHGSHEGDSRGE